MTSDELVIKLKDFLKETYPNIEIDAKPWEEDISRLALFFREEKFSVLYPQQRYHYLAHSIPQDFFDQHLKDTVWFELSPGESIEDLRYPDEELIESITPDVLSAIEQAGVYFRLDDFFAPESEDMLPEQCHGDFRLFKRVLREKGFGMRDEIDEVFDICHVIIAAGGYCDCEVLCNVSEDNRLKAQYWKKRAKEAQQDCT